MVLDVALVGTGGMMPLPNRWLSSVLLRYQGGLILISHVHGDHVTGLPGLLLTLANSGRIDQVLIVGPVGFTEVVERLLVVAPRLPFSVRYLEFGGGESFEHAGLTVTCAEAEHHVPCLAYRIDVARGR